MKLIVAIRILAGVFIGVLCMQSSFAADLAFIRALGDREGSKVGPHGSSWLFHKGDQCFAVTPSHVLKRDEDGGYFNYAQLRVARMSREALVAQADS